MKTFIDSPGRTTGLRELARTLMLSTWTPRSSATLLRLKSLVMILPPSCLASSISFMSTSLMSGKSASEMVTLTSGPFLIRCRMSSPLRPRFRFRESWESAMYCSSLRTNCGTTRVPSRKPVSQTSAMRPSMMTLVSRILKFCLWPPSAQAARRLESAKRSPRAEPIAIPVYPNRRKMKPWTASGGTKESISRGRSPATTPAAAPPIRRPARPPRSAFISRPRSRYYSARILPAIPTPMTRPVRSRGLNVMGLICAPNRMERTTRSVRSTNVPTAITSMRPGAGPMKRFYDMMTTAPMIAFRRGGDQRSRSGLKLSEARHDTPLGPAHVEPRHARADSAQNVPGNGLGPGGDPIGVHDFSTRGAEDHDLVAQGRPRDIGDVDRRQIHADAPHDGGPPAAHEDVTAVGQQARETVVVADRERGDPGDPARFEGPTVPQGGPRGHVLYIDDAGLERQDGADGERGHPGRGEITVKDQAGSDQRQPCGRMVHDGGAVCEVDLVRRLAGRPQGRDRFLEQADLAGREGIRRVVGHGEVGEGADQSDRDRPAEKREEGGHIGGGDTEPAHAGIDLEVGGRRHAPSRCGRGQGFDLIRAVDRGDQGVLEHQFGLGRREAAHDEDRRADPGAAQLDPL